MARTQDGTAIRVGECCSSAAHDIVAHLRWEPRAYVLPPRSALLWRYIDFSKYVALIRDQAVFFCRADRLGDRFELAKGIATRKAEWDKDHLEWYREVLRNPPPGASWDTTHEAVESRALELLRQEDASGLSDLRSTFISCWHENEGESEALWRLYCGTGPGVAIQTTVASLLNALWLWPNIAVGRVQYIDFKGTFTGVNEAAFRKRISLSHEREVRAVQTVYHGERPEGLSVRVRIDALIHRVVVSPLSPRWFAAVVRDTTQRFGVDVQTEHSELLLEPFY